MKARSLIADAMGMGNQSEVPTHISMEMLEEMIEAAMPSIAMESLELDAALEAIDLAEQDIELLQNTAVALENIDNAEQATAIAAGTLRHVLGTDVSLEGIRDRVKAIIEAIRKMIAKGVQLVSDLINKLTVNYKKDAVKMKKLADYHAGKKWDFRTLWFESGQTSAGMGHVIEYLRPTDSPMKPVDLGDVPKIAKTFSNPEGYQMAYISGVIFGAVAAAIDDNKKSIDELWDVLVGTSGLEKKGDDVLQSGSKHKGLVPYQVGRYYFVITLTRTKSGIKFDISQESAKGFNNFGNAVHYGTIFGKNKPEHVVEFIDVVSDHIQLLSKSTPSSKIIADYKKAIKEGDDAIKASGDDVAEALSVYRGAASLMLKASNMAARYERSVWGGFVALSASMAKMLKPAK